MILENPFRRLGLPATASARDVRRRIDELTVKGSLGAAPELPADELSRLRQALEDPVMRAGHEIFWLHVPSDVVDPNLDLSSSNGSLVAALETLRGEAGRTPSAEQAISLHALAVLTYARFLDAGNGADPGDALPLWASVLESEPFWQHMRARAAEAADARLTPQTVAQIRDEIPQALLEPLALRAAAEIDVGDLDAAAASVRFIRRSGLPSAAIDAAARRAVAPIRARINDGATAVEQLIEAIPASEGQTAETERRLDEAEGSLVERVLVPISLLRKADPVSNDDVLGDRAAAATRRLSVAFCNLMEDWESGYALVREAMELARTPAYLAQLAADQALVCSNYHCEAANDAARLGRPGLAAAHCELAIPYVRDDGLRTKLRNTAAGARAHGRVSDAHVERQKRSIIAELEEERNSLKLCVAEALDGPVAASADADEPAVPTWKPQRERSALARATKSRGRAWMISTAVAAVIVIAIAATHNGSGSSSGTAAPPSAPAVPQAPEPAAPQSSLDCSRVSVLSDRLDVLDTQINGKRRLVRRLDAQIKPIEAKIHQIVRDYPSKRLPSDVWNRYVSLRAQYKPLVARSNDAVRNGNALVRLYNRKLKAYRRLNGEC